MGDGYEDFIDPSEKNKPEYILRKQLSAFAHQMARQYKQLGDRLYAIEKRLETIENKLKEIDNKVKI